jgi:aminopeptidase YwaD
LQLLPHCRKENEKMNHTEEVLRTLCSAIGARPVGTRGNEEVQAFLARLARDLGYQVTELPFECLRWEFGASSLRSRGAHVPIHAGPYSPPLEGVFAAAFAGSLAELRGRELHGRLLCLHGELATTPVMPRDFPFYFPEEHRVLLETLDELRPAGIIALTGKHPLCGLDPYPLFDDGTFGIPNAYASHPGSLYEGPLEIVLDSRSVPSAGRQLVFSRNGASTQQVVVCAHVDTKYGTPGALDNAAGVATMLALMERMRNVELPFGIDFVPFNGEEYFGVSGQLAYLAHRQPSADTTTLVINLDGLGHRESRSAFSFYNLDEPEVARFVSHIRPSSAAVRGEEWIAGDHSMFAYRGIPCIAVTSSNLDTVLDLTHTPADRMGAVSLPLLDETAAVLAGLLALV